MIHRENPRVTPPRPSEGGAVVALTLTITLAVVLAGCGDSKDMGLVPDGGRRDGSIGLDARGRDGASDDGTVRRDGEPPPPRDGGVPTDGEPPPPTDGEPPPPMDGDPPPPL